MNNYPQDWDSKLLGNVFPKIVVGYVGNVNDHYCSESEGVAFYRTLNIRDGYFRHNDLKYVTHAFNDKNKKSQISNDDILIARVGANLGMVCKATGINGLANMANAIIIKTNSNRTADADFFTYFLLSPMGKNQIFSGAAGGAQGVFNTKLTHEIRVPTPPLSEQRKIAKILSTWDKAIRTTEGLIDNSKQQKKALMQQLLTGKKRLLDDSGKPFEGEWEEVKLGDVSDVRDGTHDSPSFIDSGYPLITSKNLLPSGKLDLNNVKFISKEDYEQINKRSNVNVGDILFGMIGTIGNPVRVSSNDYAIKNVALIKEKQSLLNSFLIFYISSLDIAKQFHRLNAGGTQKFIALGVIRNLVIRMPTHEEQLKIAAVLTNADKEIELLEQQLADLKQEKKALMQKLLTGKRRVIVDEKDVA